MSCRSTQLLPHQEEKCFVFGSGGRITLRFHLKLFDGIASLSHSSLYFLLAQAQAREPLLANHVVAALQDVYDHQVAPWLQQAAEVSEGCAVSRKVWAGGIQAQRAEQAVSQGQGNSTQWSALSHIALQDLLDCPPQLLLLLWTLHSETQKPTNTLLSYSWGHQISLGRAENDSIVPNAISSGPSLL